MPSAVCCRMRGETVGWLRELVRSVSSASTAELMKLSDIRSGNTFDGHRVIHLAEAHGLQDATKERLMRAYFTEGELVSDPETLVRLAVEVGIPEDDARETATGQRFAGP